MACKNLGKSYIVEKFAKNEYGSYILIDFSKAPARVRGWFEECVNDLSYMNYDKKLAV